MNKINVMTLYPSVREEKWEGGVAGEEESMKLRLPVAAIYRVINVAESVSFSRKYCKEKILQV